MKILAIDPSLTSMGLCYANGVTDTVDIGKKTTGIDRLLALRSEMLDVLNVHKPEVVILEDYAYAKAHKAHQLGEWGGMLRVMLHEMKFPFLVVSPGTLKRWATGSGQSSKVKVVSELSRRADKTFPNDDEADAWALWSMARQHYGQPAIKMPKDRIEAIQSLAWPELKPACEHKFWKTKNGRRTCEDCKEFIGMNPSWDPS